MKRVRVQRVAGQLLAAAARRPPAALLSLPACSFRSPSYSTSIPPAPASPSQRPSAAATVTASGASVRRTSPVPRPFSTTATASATSQAEPSAPTNALDGGGPFAESPLPTTAPGRGPSTDPRFPELFPEAASSPAYPSPLPERARSSAKLAALHARLGLSQSVPLETLARALVDASADPSPRFNNKNLAAIGGTVIAYHVCEWLLCKYPRLPMRVLYAAMKAYAGPEALADVSTQWGVEAAAAPGAEVDPGLLQFSLQSQTDEARPGYTRPELKNLKKYKWNHSVSSRVVLDDEFGEVIDSMNASTGGTDPDELELAELPTLAKLGGSLDANAKTAVANEARSQAVRAVIGAVSVYCDDEAARSLVRAHVLSRQLDVERMLQFDMPTRELAYLCARENFEMPVARLESETGRHSISPVFVVGIYSGRDKLGEGTAGNLKHARHMAVINSLKAWYLYSPGEDVRLPSEMMVEGANPWKPGYVDIGEIV